MRRRRHHRKQRGQPPITASIIVHAVDAAFLVLLLGNLLDESKPELGWQMNDK
jgi:hypothetical protein